MSSGVEKYSRRSPGDVLQLHQPPGRQLLQPHAHIGARAAQLLGDLVGVQGLLGQEQQGVDPGDGSADPPRLPISPSGGPKAWVRGGKFIFTNFQELLKTTKHQNRRRKMTTPSHPFAGMTGSVPGQSFRFAISGPQHAGRWFLAIAGMSPDRRQGETRCVTLIAPAAIILSLAMGSASFAATPAAKPAPAAKVDMKAKKAACEQSWKDQKTPHRQGSRLRQGLRRQRLISTRTSDRAAGLPQPPDRLFGSRAKRTIFTWSDLGG